MKCRSLVSAIALFSEMGFLPALAAAQGFSAQISPNPVILRAGGDAATVTVATQAAPALQLVITYSFTGFPAGISTGGSQVVTFRTTR